MQRHDTQDNQNLYWYAVHVKYRHEFKISDRLANIGIDFFLPVVERLRKWKDRKKLVDFPLFPGYLFVHIQKNNPDILTVLKIPGVVRFLGVLPGKPAPVPEEQIISLKKILENKRDIDPYPYLKQGQAVRIKRGLLAGVEGMLVKRAGQHMLVLSVDIIQQGVSLKIDASDVERI
ncbi:MAG: UpxY family transcription antiterminator [Deltaproteobacteria bacterium]|nr:UpxY family transcription antiterminator [Deltaproteobacteria bacterium]